MQSVAVMFTLIFLISQISATIIYTYSNAQCTGDALTGSQSDNNACTTDNSKPQCNATHVYDAVYTGPSCTGSFTIANPVPLNTCANYSKTSCTGSFDIPSKSVYTSTNYPQSGCSGTPTSKTFTILDTCIPDYQQQQSNKYSQTGSTLTRTKYTTSLDCTGASTTENPPVMGYSSNYISSSYTAAPGLIGYHNFKDLNLCTGAAYYGLAQVAGRCVDGTIFECVNGQLVVSQFDANDCTGAKTTPLNLTDQACFHGYMAFCSGTFSVTTPSYLTQNFDGTTCGQDTSSLEFRITDNCLIQGQSGSVTYTYNSTTNKIDSATSTSTTDCSGPLQEGVADLTSYSFAVLKPSSSAILSVNRFLFVVMVASLLYVLFEN